MEDWIKAGKIASKAREYGCSLIVEGEKLETVMDKVEEFILKEGAKPAFPAQISLNNIAAHYTSPPGDVLVFEKGDICKLDLGVCVNGAIADTAITKEIGDKNKELVEASKAALDAAIKIIKPGIQLKEIGKVIEKEITSRGFNPIRNLSGHGLGEYQIHTGDSIPNYDNGDETELKEGDTIAIEPFATTGNGFIKEGKLSTIYRVVNTKPTRSPTSRKVFAHIIEEYKTLPFCLRQLNKKFNQMQVRLAINELERAGNLYHYTQLPEASDGLVSQHEHTLIVKEKPIVTTL